MRGVEFKAENVLPGDIVKMSDGNLYVITEARETDGSIILNGVPYIPAQEKTMKIQLQNNLWVFSDSRQYVLKRFTGVNAKGEETYTNLGFFTNLGNLVKAAIRTGLQGDEIDTLQKLADRIEEIAEAVFENYGELPPPTVLPVSDFD